MPEAEYDYNEFEPYTFSEVEIFKQDHSTSLRDRNERIVEADRANLPGTDHVPTKGLGSWSFDIKSKKRKYIALSGKIYLGSEAMRQHREDLESEQHPSKSARRELDQLVQESAWILEQYTETNTLLDIYDLKTWGLPPRVLARYRAEGVSRLFEWQVCALSCEGVLHGGNLIYSAPTSGGKTLVSEILMLRRLAQHPQELSRNESVGDVPSKPDLSTTKYSPRLGKTVFYVVPLIALAEEKTRYFQNKWQDLYLGVRPFHSDVQDSTALTSDVSVAVCTIEKANNLLNILIDEQRESQLCMVVIDEIHLISDSNRGFLLEVLLSKVRFFFKERVQIVGMSATIPNLTHLGHWLDASVYNTEFRPVQLDVKVCAGATVMTRRAGASSTCSEAQSSIQEFESAFSVERVLPLPPAGPSSHANIATFSLIHLSMETLRSGKSVIVFCNSKSLCEKVAIQISSAVLQMEQGTDIDSSAGIRGLRRRQRLQLVEELSVTLAGLCPTLHTSIPQGCAYHHAGLTQEERKIIEEAFAQGVISVLCATSTLAAGVNLPANRVIIRSTRMGLDKLTVSSFRQMCGRAGRMNLDTTGEAILLVHQHDAEDRARAAELIFGEIAPLRSSLHEGRGGGVEKLLLEVIYLASKNKNLPSIRNKEDVSNFVSCTLLGYQHMDNGQAQRWAHDAMLFLLKHGFLLRLQSMPPPSDLPTGRAPPADQPFLVSALGKATVKSAISPRDAIQSVKDLQKANKCLVLKSGMQCVFLVTPPSNHTILVRWEFYEEIFETLCRLYPEVEKVAVETLGISRLRLQEYKFAAPSTKESSMKESTRLDRRFYAAMVLFCLIQERPLDSVLALMQLSRGETRKLQEDAALFCRTTVTFCRELNWRLLAACLTPVSEQLNYGVPDELLELARLGLDLMSSYRARTLYKAGFKTPSDIVAADQASLAGILELALPVDNERPVGTLSRTGAGSESSRNDSSGGDLASASGGNKASEACRRLADKLQRRAAQYIHNRNSLSALLQQEGIIASSNFA